MSPQETTRTPLPSGSPQQLNNHPARLLSSLANRSRILDARLLCGADYVEITTTTARGVPSIDLIGSPRIREIKQCVCRHPEGTYTLHALARPGVARELLAALGAPDRHDDTDSGERIHIADAHPGPGRREITILARGQVYVWGGVTIHFRRSRLQPRFIRNALFILTVRPARPNRPEVC